MAHGIAQTNGIEICYDRIGDPAAPAILLIPGAVGQMVAWHYAVLEMFAERGFQAIRYDQRDTGKSSRIPADEAYGMDNLADDAAGLLDFLGIDHAHIVGISAGGTFAQTVAWKHPDKVLSLVSMMSTSGDFRTDPMIDGPTKRIAASRERPFPPDREGRIDRILETFNEYLSGPRFPVNEDYIRDYATAMMDREGRVGDAPQLIAAVMNGAPKLAERAAQIRVPTLVIHGTADPLMRYTAGLSTARTIPGARLVTVEGMGHDMISPRFWPRMVDLIVHHAETAPPMWVRQGKTAPD